QATPATAAAPAKPPKASPADPASRVMPAKKGGVDQLHNVQPLAGRHHVIYAIAAHDNPADTGPLHPPPHQTPAHPHPRDTPGPPRRRVRESGYKRSNQPPTACEPALVAAPQKHPDQDGRLRDAQNPATMKDSWQQMAARLDTREGKALYRQRAGIIEPVF